jgi:lipoprotein-anchoring transpeptidase ErfK/SrfK
MQFENSVNLTTDGIAGPDVWTHLLEAVRTHHGNTQPYDYVYVQKNPEPENVTVYSNGARVYNTLANTGIPAAPTPDGTWPVYVRYTLTTMTGTNPNGSHYSDPGIPWVSYFHGGDALHGFIRASYGFPQSLGCVEMPFANAQVVFPLTPIGTLVTIQ